MAKLLTMLEPLLFSIMPPLALKPNNDNVVGTYVIVGQVCGKTNPTTTWTTNQHKIVQGSFSLCTTKMEYHGSTTPHANDI